MGINKSFWKKKKVLITGHTGFKGTWLTIWLESMGADIVGVSLEPINKNNIYHLTSIGKKIKSLRCDIRNKKKLSAIFKKYKPEIIFHLAAQPLVIDSYNFPVETYETNFNGTLNILENIRLLKTVRACLIVTSDKCYQNKEWNWGYRENDSMGGYDPYSSSKGACELLIESYRSSFFSKNNKSFIKIASARAGNVIGGGDFAANRLIPDAVNAFSKNNLLDIRNPESIRPWQHVLEPLSGYILLAQKLYKKNSNFDQAWNFGPHNQDIKTVKEVMEIFSKKWGPKAKYRVIRNKNLHEAKLLNLDCSKANFEMKWTPKWNLNIAIDKTIQWYKAYFKKDDLYQVCLLQIDEYYKLWVR